MAATFEGNVTSDETRPVVRVTFRFDPDFPVAFTVVFGEDVDWLVSRDLVGEALMNSCAGLGDLGLSTRAPDDFVFDMRGMDPSGSVRYAQVTLSRRLVDAFFVASERVVPATREIAWIEGWAADTLERLVGAA